MEDRHRPGGPESKPSDRRDLWDEDQCLVCPGHGQGVTFVQVPELLLCEVVPGRRHGHIGGVVAALLDQGLLAPPPLQGPGDTVHTGDRK